MNLFFGLITSSIVGSVVFFILLLLRPITGKIFSKTWHYYCLIVPLVFLLGGTHIAISLTGLMPYPTTANIPPILTSQETQMGTFREVMMPPVFDNLLNIPVYSGETDVGLASTPSTASQLLAHVESAMPTLIVLWIMGTILFIVVSTKKYLQYRRTVLHSVTSVTDINCEIPISVSIVAHTPMLIGVIKPIIVLPNMYFSDDERDMILAHELVHYRRKDLIVKLLMLIVNAVHWFNPAVYILSRRLNAECELSCDEIVVSEMNAQDRRFYGETILQVLKHSTAQKSLVGHVAFATNLCNSKKNFRRRLISMMNTKKMRKSVAALALATGMLVVGGGLVISNMVGSAMPITAYAQEVDQTDILPAITAPNPTPTVVPPVQNTVTAQTEEAAEINTIVLARRARPVIDTNLSPEDWTAYLFEEIGVLEAEITMLIPEHLRDMWDEDDAVVQGLLARNYIGGISPDDFPPYAFWTRVGMLGEIARVADLEAFHFELSRDDLAAWVDIARFIDRLSWRDAENEPLYISEWVRENYTEDTIAIYERLGAPQWLIDQLRLAISTQ